MHHYSLLYVELNTPKLSWKMLNDSAINVFWTDDGCIPNDVQYVLLVRNSTYPDPIKYITNLTNMTLAIMKGYEYNITIATQLCDGNITSQISEPLILNFQGFSNPYYFCP